MGREVTRGAGVYLDANILIRMTEGVTRDRAAIQAALAEYVAADCSFITSDLAFTEVLVHPLRQQNTALIENYDRLLMNFVEPLAVSREVLVLAAKLRARSPSQRTPDAIHVATASLAQAQVFVTGDQGIKNLPAGLQLHLL
jgi:predicted nucleic acid-binding protein